MIIIDEDYIFKEKTILTIGKFDGFHRGHKFIIDKMLSLKSSSLKSLIVSFSNHPGTVLGKKFDGLLLNSEEKADFATGSGVDYYLELLFDNKLINTVADDFFEKYIVEKWNCNILVVGDDFTFGKNRCGNIEFLKDRCRKYNIDLYVVERMLFQDKPISSSRIKAYISEGNIKSANECLGYEYFFAGNIVEGNRLGRTINFPTINIENNTGKIYPAFGVYKTIVEIDGVCYKGITNIGIKPTVENNDKITIETHILDFNSNVYGKKAFVRLINYIRPEYKFNSLDELKKQIETDKKCWT
ncbi:MAG: bifunctional riboflavin kinase/FAD synthetase [Clostridiales bacterium]|nr:bifunctional riboflavin kinase/FAD synthetase [Clostridiales bacterium]